MRNWLIEDYIKFDWIIIYVCWKYQLLLLFHIVFREIYHDLLHNSESTDHDFKGEKWSIFTIELISRVFGHNFGKNAPINIKFSQNVRHMIGDSKIKLTNILSGSSVGDPDQWSGQTKWNNIICYGNL